MIIIESSCKYTVYPLLKEGDNPAENHNTPIILVNKNGSISSAYCDIANPITEETLDYISKLRAGVEAALKIIGVNQMNYQQLYQQCHDIVWSYRDRLEHVWPTPPVEDALRFAVTEAAEVIDAELRMNPTYARNLIKDLDPLDEVADCLMMLITALSSRKANEIGKAKIVSATSNNLVYTCCMALDEFISLRSITKETIWCAITICLNMLGDEAPRRVEARLKRIELKLSKGTTKS